MALQHFVAIDDVFENLVHGMACQINGLVFGIMQPKKHDFFTWMNISVGKRWPIMEDEQVFGVVFQLYNL